MPNSPDLSTMYQNGMGALASLYGGQRQAVSQQQDQQSLIAQQLANQQSQVMNPLEAQFAQGKVAAQQAQLPGIQGQSQSLAAKGKFDTDTLATDISKKLMENQSAIGDEGLRQMTTTSQKMSNIVQVIKANNIPLMMQPAAFQKGLQAYGVDPSDPVVKPFLSNDPSQLIPSVEAFAKGTALASAKYQQDAALKAQEEASQKEIHAATNTSNEKVATTHAIAQLNSAQIMADSRMKAAESRMKSMRDHMSTDQMIAHLETTLDRTPEEDQQLKNLQAQRLKERAAGAPATASNVLGQPTPLQAAGAAAGQGNTAAPAQAPTPAGYKQVGTSNGVPVYEDASGNRFTLKGK